MAHSERVTAAVLIIGDEILSGRTQDTNLNYIAKYLGTFGIDLAEARVVSETSRPRLHRHALDALRARLDDYVVTTGGIGPTHDDITADCVAEAFGVTLYEHPEIIAMMAARWQGELNPARRRMARVPQGATLVKNPIQGPPGFQIGNVFVLAGVPAVMRGMMEDVGPRMRPGAVVISRSVRVDGAGESAMAAPLETVAKAHLGTFLAGQLSLFRSGRLRLQPCRAGSRRGRGDRDGGGIDRRTGRGGRPVDHPRGVIRRARRMETTIEKWRNRAVIYESRNYHFKPELFDQCKAGTKTKALPHLGQELDLVGFWWEQRRRA